MKRLNCFSLVSLLGLGLAGSASATIYYDGLSPAMSGVYELGTWIPGRAGTISSDLTFAPISGRREYFYDNNGYTGDITALPLKMIVYSFTTAHDSVRLYPSQDHWPANGAVVGNLAAEVMEYSVWGSNTGLNNLADWTLIGNPTGYTFPVPGKPVYTFQGQAPSEVWRLGSTEGSLLVPSEATDNAYVVDYRTNTPYLYFGIRGSSIGMAANTSDPEVDTVVAFNKSDVPMVPDHGSTLGLCGLSLLGLVTLRSRLTAANLA